MCAVRATEVVTRRMKSFFLLGGIALDPEFHQSKRHANRVPPENGIFRHISSGPAHLPSAPRPRIDARCAWMVRCARIRGRAQTASPPAMRFRFKGPNQSQAAGASTTVVATKRQQAQVTGKKNHTPQYRGCGFFAVLASLTNLGNRGEEFSSILGRSATPPIRNFPRFDYFGARRCVSGCVALGYATTSGQLSCGVDALRVGAGFSVRRLAPCRGLASAAAPASWCWGKAPATAKPRSAVAASRRRCAEPVRRSAGPRWLAVRPR